MNIKIVIIYGGHMNLRCYGQLLRNLIRTKSKHWGNVPMAVILVLIFAIGCKGPKGSTGPAGANGSGGSSTPLDATATASCTNSFGLVTSTCSVTNNTTISLDCWCSESSNSFGDSGINSGGNYASFQQFPATNGVHSSTLIDSCNGSTCVSGNSNVRVLCMTTDNRFITAFGSC